MCEAKKYCTQINNGSKRICLHNIKGKNTHFSNILYCDQIYTCVPTDTDLSARTRDKFDS
jgi:hypothetical protein